MNKTRLLFTQSAPKKKRSGHVRALRTKRQISSPTPQTRIRADRPHRSKIRTAQELCEPKKQNPHQIPRTTTRALPTKRRSQLRALRTKYILSHRPQGAGSELSEQNDGFSNQLQESKRCLRRIWLAQVSCSLFPI